MSLRKKMVELTSIEQVDQFLDQHPTSAIFKVGSCHKTMQGFGVVENALNKRDSIHLAFVRVIEMRPVSNYIAEITRITHHSPQFILFVNGQAVYDVDNWDIVPDAVESALLEFLGPVSEKETLKSKMKHADVSVYIDLLEEYLQGQINDQEFRKEWLLAFQSDSSLRSTQEFEILNSLFGDVDLALAKNDDLAVAKNVDLALIKNVDLALTKNDDLPLAENHKPRDLVSIFGEIKPPCASHNPLKEKARKLLYEIKSQINS